MSSGNGSKFQPWKAAVAERYSLNASSDTYQEPAAEGEAGAIEGGAPDIFRCQGSKQQNLEKLLYDSRQALEATAQGESETIKGGPDDIFGCKGSKQQNLEKLIYDTQEELKATAKGEAETTKEGTESQY